jgi:hypothetical protein
MVAWPMLPLSFLMSSLFPDWVTVNVTLCSTTNAESLTISNYTNGLSVEIFGGAASCVVPKLE